MKGSKYNFDLKVPNFYTCFFILTKLEKIKNIQKFCSKNYGYFQNRLDLFFKK